MEFLAVVVIEWLILDTEAHSIDISMSSMSQCMQRKSYYFYFSQPFHKKFKYASNENEEADHLNTTDLIKNQIFPRITGKI